MPMPELQGSAGEVMMGFAKAGYIFPAVGLIETIVGFLLLINRFSALALILMAPITVNMLLFHLYHDLGGIVAAAVIGVLNIVLLFAYKPSYAGVLAVNSEMCSCSEDRAEETE